MEPQVCKIKEYRIEAGAAKRKVTVALTGDWHISHIVGPRQQAFLRESLGKIQPDVILVQGDMVDSPAALKETRLQAQLVDTLSSCAKIAPTLAVLGNHDLVDPGKKVVGKRRQKTTFAHFLSERVLPEAEKAWREVCEEAGVRLLLDETIELTGIRFFGFYQDAKCSFKDGRWQDNLEEDRRKLKELRKAGKLAPKAGKINWFLAHAPMGKLMDEAELLEGFDVVSFGHTHGGCVPRGLDEIFDWLGYTGGLYGPFGKILPLRQMRGKEKLPGGGAMIINTGMVFAQECAPEFLQKLNWMKAAEVTSVCVVPGMGLGPITR